MTVSKHRIAPRRPSVLKECATCGTPFRVKASLFERTKFCSMACKRRSVELVCRVCGEPFRAKRTQADGRVCCSRTCLALLLSARARGEEAQPAPPDPNFTCRVCGQREYYPPSEARRRTYCSSACMGQDYAIIRRGERGTNWKGGLAQLARYLRTSRPMRDWAQQVLTASDGQCAKCGEAACHAHHIKAFAALLAELFDPANGIALCDACHAGEPGHNRNLVRRPPRA